MALYYKFLSTKDYHTIPVDAPFICVGTLKQKIFESKYKANISFDSKNSNNKKKFDSNLALCLGTDYDLVVINAQTHEAYVDDNVLIPKNSSVLIRRVPGTRGRRNPLDITPIVFEHKRKSNASSSGSQSTTIAGSQSSVSAGSGSGTGSGSTVTTLSAEFFDVVDDDDFGGDVYAVPGAEKMIQQPSMAVASEEDDEESRVRALVNTPALDWQHGAGFGMMGRSYVGGLERNATPPEGYVCHRCNVAGHYIKHCPTNGDPSYNNFKRIRNPTGIPKSMLVENSDGHYALSGGAVAVLKPDEGSFEKEIEGIPSSRRSICLSDVPPELLCPLCKQLMKDAVLTSKCCFRSFCHMCIRDQLVKSNCVCGADVLADFLIPNITLRDTINHFLVSDMVTSNESVDGNSSQIMESQISPNTASVVSSKTDLKRLSSDIEERANKLKLADAPQQMSKRAKTAKEVDVSEAEPESTRKEVELAATGSAREAGKDFQQKQVSDEVGMRKRKRRTSECVESETNMLPVDSYAFPYWTGVHQGMEGYVPRPYYYAGISYGVMPQHYYTCQ